MLPSQEAVDSFIVQKLSPLSRRNLLRGASSFAGGFRSKANIAMTPTAFRGLTEVENRLGLGRFWAGDGGFHFFGDLR